ncbi:MAG: NAD(P)/FAD-dependent oxidoreductase [Bosea sp. (in: a-proteobacteria)]
MTSVAWDVAVVGAGPCGSALARMLAVGGAKVLLVDRGRFETRRPGELAQPDCRESLRKLGLEYLLSPPFGVEVPSILSVWTEGKCQEHEYIRSPYGAAVSLNRQSFDEALARAAEAAGARLLTGAPCIVERAHDHSLRVYCGSGESIRAVYVVICDGRHSRGAGFNIARLALNDHVCVAGVVGTPLATSAMLVEAVPQGWLYALNQSSGTSILALNTRRKFAVGAQAKRTLWQQACMASTLIAKFAKLPSETEIVVWNSAASITTKIGGTDWCMLGDARFASDPLSGHGLLHALDDATIAAELILAGASRNLAQEMKARTIDQAQQHVKATLALYGTPARFAEEPFWSSVRSK